MLLLLTISNLILLTFGNPFHKYPFVFLLDVGNEELKTTETNQIRLTVPGGSIALRYPGVEGGDTIAHVRVSGIDFGTDLRANIADGGPGYNYVVLMFNGNPGVTYDAVMTIQTVPNTIDSNNVVDNTVEVSEEDSEEDNNSAEELDNTEQADQSQATSDVIEQPLSYKVNENDNEGYITNENDEKPIQNNYEELIKYMKKQSSISNRAYAEDSNEQNDIETPKAEPYSISDGYVAYDDKSEEPIEPRGYVDNNLYDKFNALKPHLYDDVKAYPQSEDSQFEENSNDVAEEDPAELDQMFNDEEIHSDNQKYNDENNNDNFDTDDSNAVAY